MKKLFGVILITIGLLFAMMGFLILFAEFILGVFILLISSIFLTFGFKMLSSKAMNDDFFKNSTDTQLINRRVNNNLENHREFPEISKQREYQRESVSKVFFVVGNYKGELRKNMSAAVQTHVDRYKNMEYDNSSLGRLKKLLENYNRIFKYEQMNVKSVDLVDEPDNPYDPKAIAVYFKDYKVGYIRQKETDLIREYQSRNYEYYSKIMGGPFVTQDMNDELVEKNEPFKMEIIFNYK